MVLKFYTDTHIPKQVAIQLRNKGVDVVRCEEAGMATASDSEHLEYATRENRCVVSIDRDFPRLNKQWIQDAKPHAGIFCVAEYLQGKNAIGRIVTELHEYHQLVDAGAATLEDDFANQIIYIT